MTTLKIAGFSAFAVTALIAANAPAQADSLYFPVSMCQGTDQNGEIAGTVRFRSGVAENFHDSEDRYLRCPIPYDPDGNSPVIVRAVGFDNNNSGDGRLRAVICETLHNNTNTCSDADQSGAGFIGTETLEVQYFPGPNTRWLGLTLTIPDADAQSGRSFYYGYRVCYGAC
jgi:hypothetical protein